MDLFSSLIQVALIPNHEISPGRLLVNVHLGVEDAAGLFVQAVIPWGFFSAICVI